MTQHEIGKYQLYCYGKRGSESHNIASIIFFDTQDKFVGSMRFYKEGQPGGVILVQSGLFIILLMMMKTILKMNLSFTLRIIRGMVFMIRIFRPFCVMV